MPLRTSSLLLAFLLPLAAQAQQDPGVIPGLTGTDLPAGHLPKPDPRVLSDLFPTDEPVPPPAFGVTGDWFGARTALLDDGIQLKTNLTQFGQGVAAGGLRESFRYGLKFDYFGIINGEKLLGWEGFLINIHAESRFGESTIFDDGDVLPANFALLFPTETGSASAITNLQFLQFLTPEWVVSVGKINTVDAENIRLLMGGYGTDRFMNTGFVVNPIFSRAIPYSTPGALLCYLPNLDPLFTVFVVDPEGRPDTPGLAHLFHNGATICTQLRLPVEPFGMPGHQILETVYSSGRFDALAGDDYVILPGSRLAPRNLETGTWAVNYGLDQLLITPPDDPTRGIGVFGNISISDGDPNPVRAFLNLGLGGLSPLPGRGDDSFGVAYYYMTMSSIVRRTLDFRNEQGSEFYYNARINRWFTISLNLQAIDPANIDASSPLILGLRAKIVF